MLISKKGDKDIFFHQGKFARKGSVVIGTTSECSAMCSCCPGYRYSRGVMSMSLWESIVDQVMELSWFPYLGIGLFGESIQDPFLLKRLQYFHQKKLHWLNFFRGNTVFPILGLSTNAHFLFPSVIEEIIKYVDIFTIHVESHQPNIYKKLMPKLVYDQVVENIVHLLMINKKWNRKITISLPLHKINYEKKEEMKLFWLDLGVKNVDFYGFSNRCGSLKSFHEMSIPQFIHHGWCHGEVLADLIIDWDGSVLLCCQDFRHDSRMANLKDIPIKKVMLSKQRKKMHNLLESERWDEISVCHKCQWQEIP